MAIKKPPNKMFTSFDMIWQFYNCFHAFLKNFVPSYTSSVNVNTSSTVVLNTFAISIANFKEGL